MLNLNRTKARRSEPSGSLLERASTKGHGRSPVRALLARWPRNRWISWTGAAWDDDGDADTTTGVYAVLKKTNSWFNAELETIEKQARVEAARWAERGLPYPSSARNEPLPVEQALAARCTETFRVWIERVRTKMQDAIEEAGQTVAQRMVVVRFGIRRLESAQLELDVQQRQLDALRATAQPPAGFGYHALLKPWIGIGLLTLLLFVEFAANFPLFRILLPMNPALTAAAQGLAERAADKGSLTGPYHWVQDLMLRPEALVVSFVVVIVVVVLGDSLGDSVRPLVALSAKDNPAAACGIRRHRAQHFARIAMALAGLAAALGFLFHARQNVPVTAIQRVAADSAALARVDRALAAATAARSTAVGALAVEREDAAQVLKVRRDEASYARTVQTSNMSILWLNVALVLTAAVIGFSKKHEQLTDESSVDPRVEALERTIGALRQESLLQRQAVAQALVETRTGISRVHHLLSAKPLEEWQARAKRLSGVIQLFRSDNARLRNLDPSEVLAFQSNPTISFAMVEEATYRAPAGFDGYTEEFESLAAQFARLTQRDEHGEPGRP